MTRAPIATGKHLDVSSGHFLFQSFFIPIAYGYLHIIMFQQANFLLINKTDHWYISNSSAILYSQVNERQFKKELHGRKLFLSLLSHAQIGLWEGVDDFYFPLGNVASFSNWLGQSLLKQSPAMHSQFSAACSLPQLLCTFQFNEIIFPWCFAGFSCPFLFSSGVIMLTNILSKRPRLQYSFGNTACCGISFAFCLYLPLNY